jgi:hypothetical protein
MPSCRIFLFLLALGHTDIQRVMKRKIGYIKLDTLFNFPAFVTPRVYGKEIDFLVSAAQEKQRQRC